MNWTRAIEAYGRHLGSERGMSPHTSRAYLSDVRQLTLHTGSEIEPDRVDADHVRSWLASLNKRRSAATRGRKLASIRSFFRWLVREGARRDDPTAGLPMPKNEKRLPRPLSIDDCAQLVTAERRTSRRPAPEGSSRARSDQWLSLRDQQSFVPGDPWTDVSLDCARDLKAIQFILLREAAMAAAKLAGPDAGG